ncbi:hypothetical protein RUND412_009680 [Rhizina undulata]
MHKKPNTEVLYKLLFPRPSSKDPKDFDEFVMHCIVPEIRSELTSWYGKHLNEEMLDNLYPGWDYTNPKVRERLDRYVAHSRLFFMFKKAELSDAEIDAVVTWFGTKHEKLRYEQEQGREVNAELELEYELEEETSEWDDDGSYESS